MMLFEQAPPASTASERQQRSRLTPAGLLPSRAGSADEPLGDASLPRASSAEQPAPPPPPPHDAPQPPAARRARHSRGGGGGGPSKPVGLLAAEAYLAQYYQAGRRGGGEVETASAMRFITRIAGEQGSALADQAGWRLPHDAPATAGGGLEHIQHHHHHHHRHRPPSPPPPPHHTAGGQRVFSPGGWDHREEIDLSPVLPQSDSSPQLSSRSAQMVLSGAEQRRHELLRQVRRPLRPFWQPF
jgi:hypothetical protein